MSFNYLRYGSYVGDDKGTSSKQGVHDITTGHLVGDGATLIFKVWGPGGGCGTNYSNVNRSHGGGNGGYAEGTLVAVPNGTTFYIVPGEGGISQTGSTHPARYNGGARAGNGNYYGGSSGGATHVATATGLLSTLSGNTGAVVIVAGGGGGGGNTSHGGDGGGNVGETESTSTQYGNRTPGNGGTQSAGGSVGSYGGVSGSFGQGGYSNQNLAGVGGGGWYGGSGGNNSTAGGGGSGYVGYTGDAGNGIPALTSTTNTQGGGSLGGIGQGGGTGNQQSSGTEGIDGKVEVWANGVLHTTFLMLFSVQTFTVGS